MRRDVYHYFQQAYRRQLRPLSSPLRFIDQDGLQAAFAVSICDVGRIERVDYRCTTCMTLVALCEHVAEQFCGATLEEARSLCADQLLELHPEIPASRRCRAHLALNAARAALETFSS
jgi:NifU-like protein involved in Fe-S cluster formation